MSSQRLATKLISLISSTHYDHKNFCKKSSIDLHLIMVDRINQRVILSRMFEKRP